MTSPRAAGGDFSGRTVAVVIAEPTANIFGHPYFSAVVEGIRSALAAQSVLPVLLTPETDRETELAERFLTSGRVDGAILVSLKVNSLLPGRLCERGIPVVIQGRPPRGVDVSFVDIDNRQAGQLAVGHLIAQGRRRIAAITGTLEMPSGIERQMGYRDALSAVGITLDQTLIEVGDYRSDRAYIAMERLLLNHPDLDGVFAAADLMAEAAIRVLHRAKRRIPEDVAVIGFDDSPIAWATNPPLSSIRQPIEEMGREAVDLILQKIEDPSGLPRQAILSAELVTRESTIGPDE
jgi:DNA-binding LacI/PurR family transcriptional regulator